MLWLSGKADGPYTKASVKAMLARSMVTAGTPCCHNGDEKWSTLEEMEDIFD